MDRAGLQEARSALKKVLEGTLDEGGHGWLAVSRTPADLEAEAARSVRDADPRERDRTIRSLLDATLLLKPYIFNLTLYGAYRKDRS